MFVPIEDKEGISIPFETTATDNENRKKKEKIKARAMLLSIEKRDGRVVPYDI